VPENWTTTYNQWLENIQDWCISRQLWWGHRIPAWYDADGNVYRRAAPRGARPLAAKVLEARPAAERLLRRTRRARHLVLLGAVALLDAGLAGDTCDLERYLPTSVLVTGFDIIFFWVARMVMMTCTSPARCRSARSTSPASCATPKARR
jgi:valyl-tRNA synthetase